MPVPIRRLSCAICLVLACAALAACGGGSSTKAAATTSTTPGGANGGRFAALRTCLAQNGINLPQRTPGQRRGPGQGGGAGGGIFGGGGGGGGATGPTAPGGPTGPRGLRLPPGVTQAQLQAAVAKCGGGAGFGTGGRRQRLATPATKTALDKFAACMRQDGIALPAPNTTGVGPVFNTAKLNTASPQFTAATTKCTPLLPPGFGRGGGGGGPPPGGPTA